MTSDLTFQRAAEDSGKLAAPIFSLPPPFFCGLFSLQASRGGDAAGFTLKEHVERSWRGSRPERCNANRNLLIKWALSRRKTCRFCQSLKCSRMNEPPYWRTRTRGTFTLNILNSFKTLKKDRNDKTPLLIKPKMCIFLKINKK